MFDNFFTLDISAEVITSLIVMIIVMIIAFIIGFKAKHQDPLKKPKGLFLIAEIGVKFFDNLAKELVGPGLPYFGGVLMGIAIYLFMTLIFGITGLPSPAASMAIPLSLGLTTFLLIHFTSVRFTKWSYFKRYVEPIPVFLPINLVSMWAPLLSLTLRLFGNVIAGWTILTIVEAALKELSALIISVIPIVNNPFYLEVLIVPFPKAILSLYFDLFSSFIQTSVFILLTAILVGQEIPEEYSITTLERRN